MRLSRRAKSDDVEADADVATDAEEFVEEPEAPTRTAPKGRPTPKRRDSEGRRGPVSAPKTRKEAYARQKQLAKEQKSTAATARPRSAAEQRAALRRGDPSALPRRDQGPTRKLARDYVDSHRMLSNYLLWLFPIMIVSTFVHVLFPLQLVVLAAFIGLLVEWYLVGKRIRALATERYGSAQNGNMTIGFYAGSRAYLPRKWRLPKPEVERGDKI